MSSAASAPVAEFGSQAILVVDDEEIVLAAIRETLRRERYEVQCATNPLVALEELKKREYCVIISDQRMPGLTGLDLLGEARKIQPNATRILITAIVSLDTVVDAINQGEIFRFIVKPWLREEFLATVRNGVQRYELICQNNRLQKATHAMNEQLIQLNHSLEEKIKLVALQNERLGEVNAALDANLVRSLELCVHTMQTFYPSLGNQARRVFQLCRSMAKVLGLPTEEARVLESSALLHDIGLVGVPRQIIRRWQENPVTLEPAEKILIEQHPILGQELAAFGSNLEKIGEIIRAHHERVDGAGYPDRLAGENIPWLARLLSVAIAYASSSIPESETIERIKLAAGSEFDSDAVRVMLRALPATILPRKERSIILSELRPGMVLAHGIYTSNGLLLMPEGQSLNSTYIEKLLNHNRVQPISQALTVYC